MRFEKDKCQDSTGYLCKQTSRLVLTRLSLFSDLLFPGLWYRLIDFRMSLRRTVWKLMRFMSLGENGISTSERLQQGLVNCPVGVDIGMSEAPETGGD